MRPGFTGWLLVLSLLGAAACGGKETPVSLQPVDSSSPYFASLSSGSMGPLAIPSGTGFDFNGNIVSQTDEVTSSVYTYDTNGRLTSHEVTFNGATIKTDSVYDIDGNKIAFYGEGTTYTFVNSQVRVVNRNGGSPVALLSYEDTETADDGSPKYFLKDHLGSVVAVAQANGDVIEAKDTLPFGQEWYSFSSAAQPVDYGFNGNRKEGIQAFNRPLIDYAARHLQAVEGRFLQADTVIPDPGSILSYNRYIYTSNNPVNRIDPTGHADTPDWFYQLAQTGNRVTEAWNQFAEGLGDALTLAQAGVEAQYPLLGAWRQGVEAVRNATQFNAQANPSPGTLAAVVAAGMVPATLPEVALAVADVANGPAPDLTAAKVGVWLSRENRIVDAGSDWAHLYVELTQDQFRILEDRRFLRDDFLHSIGVLQSTQARAEVMGDAAELTFGTLASGRSNFSTQTMEKMQAFIATIPGKSSSRNWATDLNVRNSITPGQRARLGQLFDPTSKYNISAVGGIPANKNWEQAVGKLNYWMQRRGVSPEDLELR